MAQPAPADLPSWKYWVATGSAIFLAVIFLISGIWKISDPLGTAARMMQALVPSALALPVALATGVIEAWAGVMIVVPRWRRWGGWLCVAMLTVFMIYFGVNYQALRGADCSCFPWLKRIVGPGFFISDALMLVLAGAAVLWSRPSQAVTKALVALGALVVFAGVVYGVTAVRLTGVRAPSPLVVDGKPTSIEQGRTLLFFFDPECTHCLAAAQAMAQWQWKDVRLIAIPTVNPQWAGYFLQRAGLRASVSNDSEKLRAVFKFTDPPYFVALEEGRQEQVFPAYDENEPHQTLIKMGWLAK
jgi:uncharacterized membrane protein YphA (DoxX/SURF4 family)